MLIAVGRHVVPNPRRFERFASSLPVLNVQKIPKLLHVTRSHLMRHCDVLVQARVGRSALIAEPDVVQQLDAQFLGTDAGEEECPRGGREEC